MGTNPQFFFSIKMFIFYFLCCFNASIFRAPFFSRGTQCPKDVFGTSGKKRNRKTNSDQNVADFCTLGHWNESETWSRLSFKILLLLEERKSRPQGTWKEPNVAMVACPWRFIFDLIQTYLGDTMGSVPDHNNQASHTHFWVSQCIKVIFILYCSLLSVQ